MIATQAILWSRFQRHYLDCPSLGLGLDISRVPFPDDFHAKMERPIRKALSDMAELERGAIANPDEQRMVGHYWLRNPSLAPSPAITQAIQGTLEAIGTFTARVHRGELAGASGPFRNVLVIGIGGSALGPQFVAKALGHPRTDTLTPYFFDNTDPDGMDQVLAALEGRLGQTLALVISKSGGTPETRNGMVEARAAYERAGLRFAAHAVAITGDGSALHKTAVAEGWIQTFPMWDWVGGRTSELSAVGLLPAALQGLDIQGLLAGAKACDEATRNPVARDNPAAQLALMWYFLGEGRGTKDMVVLPYKDRFELFSKYLQQLVMESLGKELDLDGKVVHQGLAVYGNKGSTDQHAYVQQLRDGVANFFAVFIEVLRDRDGGSIEVEPGATSGDFLSGFFLGTRSALYESGRPSLTLTVPDTSAFTVGMLIALFERAVGLYASLVNINAYHQPGVEAGKKAAAVVLGLQRQLVAHLAANPGKAYSADALAAALDQPDAAEMVFKICTHLAANRRGVVTASGAGLGATFKSC
jgi:glucose-6-phosphate isomerase